MTILLTGSSRGIGAATLTSLRDAGARVIGHATRPGAGVDCAADFADPAAPRALWAAALAQAGGTIDVLVNNAGVFEPNPLDRDADDWVADWERTQRINLTAAAELSRLAVLHWQERGGKGDKSGGRIVNIASRAAYRGDSPAHWHYAAAKAGKRFERVIDVGTGTGLLAFAAVELWPEALVIATDIDPVAVEVTRENAARNHIAADAVRLFVADGARHPDIDAAAPYDLVIANILAGPLVSMAPELAAIAAPHATIVLAGLLETQRETVVAAYRACGCTLEAIDRRGDWTVLRLTAGAERYVPTAPFDPKGRDGWALDL